MQLKIGRKTQTQDGEITLTMDIKKSTKALVIVAALALVVLICFSVGLLNLNNTPRLNAFNKIPYSSSLKYLYSDIDFSAPKEELSLNCGALDADFIKKLSGYEKKCLSIDYKTTEYKTRAILIKGAIKNNSSSSRLLVYNHGHGGLPVESESFAYNLIFGALETGNDVLLVSMPFIGIDKQSQPIKVKTWDGEATYDPKVLEGSFAAWHGVFEMFDTGESHYMRFFIDNAVLNILSLEKQYKAINFVGLSGGATTGLYTCNVLKELLNNCILVAGVMPLKYRFTKATFGDAEQNSSSFFKKHSVIDLVKEISQSPEKLQLVYNDKDACCFNEESARQFKNDLEAAKITVDVLIRNSAAHNYDPDIILKSINAN